MDKLRQAGLTINVKKSKFFSTSLTVLGHVVFSDKIQMDPKKRQSKTSQCPPTKSLLMSSWAWLDGTIGVCHIFHKLQSLSLSGKERGSSYVDHQNARLLLTLL